MNDMSVKTGRIVPVPMMLSALLAGFLLGVWVTWCSLRPQLVVEASAPAEVQADGSLVAERAPGALRPAQQLPAGAQPARVASIRVQPKPLPGSPAGCDCEQVVVDTTLVREAGGGQRLVVSAQGGQLLDAVDSPLLPEVVVRPLPWAAGVTYGTGGRAGVFVDRDAGPFRVGAEVDQADGEAWQVRVRVGWRF